MRTSGPSCAISSEICWSISGSPVRYRGMRGTRASLRLRGTRSVQPVAGVTEAGNDERVLVQLRIERGGEDARVGGGFPHPLDAFGRGDEAQRGDRAGAAPRSMSQAVAREPPVASIGSTMYACRPARSSGSRSR